MMTRGKSRLLQSNIKEIATQKTNKAMDAIMQAKEKQAHQTSNDDEVNLVLANLLETTLVITPTKSVPTSLSSISTSPPQLIHVSKFTPQSSKRQSLPNEQIEIDTDLVPNYLNDWDDGFECIESPVISSCKSSPEGPHSIDILKNHKNQEMFVSDALPFSEPTDYRK